MMTDAYKKSRRNNTAALRRAIRNGWIKVDTERGVVLKPNGEPIHIRPNGSGYFRFKIQRKKCRQYFVHKAIYLATGKPFRHDLYIDHINDDHTDNRGENLAQLTPAQNSQKSRERLSNKLMQEFPVPF